MRHLLLSLLFIGALVPAAFSQDDAPAVVTEALVTLRVNALDDACVGRIVKTLGHERNATLEYSCVRSGIVILGFKGLRVSEKADVMSEVRRLLQEAEVRGAVDFLDVHVEQSAGNKC